MLYRPGDTVLISSDGFYFGDDTKKFCGTIMTIDYIIHGEYEDDDTYYEMVEDGNLFMWFDEQIERKVVLQQKQVIRITSLPTI